MLKNASLLCYINLCWTFAQRCSSGVTFGKRHFSRTLALKGPRLWNIHAQARMRQHDSEILTKNEAALTVARVPLKR